MANYLVCSTYIYKESIVIMLYVRWKQEEIELHLNKQSYGNAYKHTYFMKIMRPVQIWNAFPVQIQVILLKAK